MLTEEEGGFPFSQARKGKRLATVILSTRDAEGEEEGGVGVTQIGTEVSKGKHKGAFEAGGRGFEGRLYIVVVMHHFPYLG